jgi:hypothetical protein
MERIQYFVKEVRESWAEARRQIEIYLFLQRYIARNKKRNETGKVFNA